MRLFLSFLASIGLLAWSLPAEASFINYSTKEINVKIIYVGPSAANAAENLHYIYERTRPDDKGKLISLDTESGRAVFFDFAPQKLGTIKGFTVRFHLYALEGVPDENVEERKLLLKGADAVVFVASTSRAGAKSNLEILRQLKSILPQLGYKLAEMPLVFQLNGEVEEIPNLAEALSVGTRSVVRANTATGEGVFDTLKETAKLCLTALKIEKKKRTTSRR